MDYAELCNYYQKLDSTTKRLEKTSILVELLKKTSVDDLRPVIYLLHGTVFPEWDPRKLGVSSQIIIKALVTAMGVNKEEVVNLWKKLGDLGLAAEELDKKKKQKTLHSEKLIVKKVFTNIERLATLEGKGTVANKIQLLAELLGNANSIEARYVVRTVLGNLRVGVAEGIVRDAISKAYDNNVKEIEEAFNLLLDYAEVARLAKENKLHNVELHAGRPINMMLAVPATDINEAFEIIGKPAQFEYKLDGFRCITGYTSLYTLNKGYISVRDLKIGDLVLTHKGNFKKITKIYKRTIGHKEKLFRIQTFLGESFKISEGHKILVIKGNKEEWMPVENISKNDILAFPIPKFKEKSILKDDLALTDDSGYSKKIKVDSFFFRFLGFWIGDGFTNNYHNTERVGLLFNRKTESKLCHYYYKNIKEKFGIKNVTKSVQNNLINLYFRDKPLRIWLSENFRIEWKGKKIPKWFLGIKKHQFESFIQGYLESDGHVDSIGRSSITTKEKDLAMFIQLLALKFKKVYGITKFRINGKTYYKLIIPKSDKHYRIFSNKIGLKILKLEELKKRDPRTKLYNLEISGDESYCTSLVALHNCQIHKDKDNIKIFTRRFEEVSNQFPDIIKFVKEHVNGKSFILDCEAVGVDKRTGKYLPFQSIGQRIRRKYDIGEMSKNFPVELNLFDIINYNGENLFSKSLEERRKLLEKIVKQEKGKIILTKKLVTDNEKEANDFFKQALAAGVEGLMGKNLKGEYRPGRYVGGWVKLKKILEPLDLVIVKAEWGEGKRASSLSSYTVACRNGSKLEELGKVSTGMKEKSEGLTFEEMTKMLKPLITNSHGREVTVKPEIVVEIGYQEIQKSTNYSSGFALRFPRVLRLRTDEKTVKQINTLQDVKKIYEGQLGKKKQGKFNVH